MNEPLRTGSTPPTQPTERREPRLRTQPPAIAPARPGHVGRCNRVVWRQSSPAVSTFPSACGSPVALLSPGLPGTRSPGSSPEFHPQNGKRERKRKPPARRMSKKRSGCPHECPGEGVLKWKRKGCKVPGSPGCIQPRAELPPTPRPRRRGGGGGDHSPGRGSIYPPLGGTEAGSAGRPGSPARPRILPRPSRRELSPRLRRTRQMVASDVHAGRALSGLSSDIHGIQQEEGRKQPNLFSSPPG